MDETSDGPHGMGHGFVIFPLNCSLSLRVVANDDDEDQVNSSGKAVIPFARRGK
jgi:hypothetical protein